MNTERAKQIHRIEVLSHFNVIHHQGSKKYEFGFDSQKILKIIYTLGLIEIGVFSLDEVLRISDILFQETFQHS